MTNTQNAKEFIKVKLELEFTIYEFLLILILF